MKHLTLDQCVLQSAAKTALRRITPLFRQYIRPKPNLAGKKLLDQFHDKMRSLHYALATEKSYRPWIVEFLRFHRVSGEWRHPEELGKPEIEAFLTYLAIDRQVSANSSRSETPYCHQGSKSPRLFHAGRN